MTTKYSPLQMSEIGKHLKEARLSMKLSQGQVCYKARIPSIKVLSKFELGQDVPKGERLKNLAKVLGVTEDYILEGEKMIELKPIKAVSVTPEEKTVEVKPEETLKMTLEATEPVKSISVRKSLNHRSKSTDDNRWDYLWIKGDVFRKLRKDANLSNKEVAEFFGITETAIWHWDNGKKRMAPTHIRMFCELVGVTEDILIDKERNEKEPVDRKNQTHLPNPKTKIVVTLEEDIPMITEIPENAEQQFVKNVRYYIHLRGLNEKEFIEKIGGEEGYFDIVLKHNTKIPLSCLIKIGRELGFSIEDLVFDESAKKVENEILEMERKIRDLRAQIGM